VTLVRETCKNREINKRAPNRLGRAVLKREGRCELMGTREASRPTSIKTTITNNRMNSSELAIFPSRVQVEVESKKSDYQSDKYVHNSQIDAKKSQV
jgi:hypothetical protein